ncbi:hypothetical protein K501DRAFT_271009 [Backusella circina FSU 941]|nr:hypothetical protein K501DRAFT_271009 [Backusella circina FSU 941]
MVQQKKAIESGELQLRSIINLPDSSSIKITRYYDRELWQNKSRFRKYISKQKARVKIYKRLLNRSSKYQSSASPVQASPASKKCKWRPLNPGYLCHTKTTKHAQNAIADDIYPVLVCSSYNTHWNRDRMASLNTRLIFMYMANHKNRRAKPFARPPKEKKINT